MMRSIIEKNPEFATLINNDLIALLEVIKTLMHDSVRYQYHLVSMTDVLSRVFNVKQMENKNLLDYVKRFKQLRDVATNQLGRGFLHKFV